MPIMVALLGPSVAPVDEVHDGSFDHSVSSQVFFVGWRMHHACALSKIDQNPWFEKSADVCPIVRNGSRSPQWCGPGGAGKVVSVIRQ